MRLAKDRTKRLGKIEAYVADKVEGNAGNKNAARKKLLTATSSEHKYLTTQINNG